MNENTETPVRPVSLTLRILVGVGLAIGAVLIFVLYDLGNKCHHIV
jgi:hypothetical protein